MPHTKLNTYRTENTPPVLPAPVAERRPRSEFLRRTVDMIDRAALNHDQVDVRMAVLDRFVQDWKHRAHAPMLIELGEVLGDLVAHAGFDETSDEAKEWKEKAQIVDDLISKVTGIHDTDDLDWRKVKVVYQFVHDLAEHFDTDPDADGIEEMRDKLLGDDRSDEELHAEVEGLKGELDEVKKERDAAEKEKGMIERDRDDLMVKCEAYEKTLRELRATITTALGETG